MKKLLMLPALFCCMAFANAQYNMDASVGYIVQRIPETSTQSAAGIAQYFNEKFSSPAKKLEAIHTWVSANIKYDTDSATIINWNPDSQLKVSASLRRRKGVCENYTAIFHAIAKQCGLVTAEVDGYTKQNGRLDRSGHSWIAVQLNNEWLLCDPTWDKDSRNQFNYFLVQPAQLIQSHMPFDYIWQLLTHPVSHSDFIRGTNSANAKQANWNFADSITAYFALDSLQQLQAKKLRMLQAGPANELVSLTASATNMKIRIIQEEKMELLYNKAVNNFNKGLNSFNSYLQRGNKDSLPENQRQRRELFNQVEVHISAAKNNIRELEAMYNNFQFDPLELKNKIIGLEERIRNERATAGIFQL